MHRNLYVNPQFSRVTTTNQRKCSVIHYHKEYELYYLISGTTKYFIDDKVHFVEAGNFVLIPPNAYHMTDSESCLNTERILLSIPQQLLTPTTMPIVKDLCVNNVIVLPPNKLLTPLKLIELMESEEAQKQEYETSKYLIDLYIQELLIYIHRYQTKNVHILSDTEKLINRISQYIAENYSTELSLKALGKEFGISESHLSRQFKQITDIGLKDYINHIRILNAEKLLENTTMSITQIAQHCGYSDSNYFSTLFKSFKGMSPSSYRNKFC